MTMETDRIKGVRESCRIASMVMERASRVVVKGATTFDVAEVAAEAMAKFGARSAFLGYHGFPGVLCISLNDEVLHGIPSRKRVISGGDIVKLDLGVVFNGFYSDMAATFLIDDGSVPSDANRRLMEATLSALMSGIAAARPGVTVEAVATAIYGKLKSRGYEPVDSMSGHGVGRRLHEPPLVPNRTEGWDCSAVLSPGMTIAIEPMVGAGTTKIRVRNDGWTVVVEDGMPSSHFEHTVLITEGDPEILTADPR